MAVLGNTACAKRDRACSRGKIKFTRSEFLAECRVFGSREREAVDMTNHVSKSEMEQFSLSTLPQTELNSISDHLTTCQACHQLFVEVLRRQNDSTGLSFTMEAKVLLRHEHIEYERLVGLADDSLDATDKEIIDTH